MTTEIDQQRAVLREYVIEQRDALTKEQLRAASRDLCLLLESTPEFHHSIHIAAYWPVRGEADVRPIIEQALRYNKRVHLPVIGEDERLRFAPYDADTPMKKNRFGVSEPDVPADQLVSPRDMELVIVPLVVFDTYGNRLGMGGGFYDRTFAFINDEPEGERPVLVGAAHEFQHTGSLPAHPWDVPTRLVVTEQQVWRQTQAAAEADAAAH